MTSSSFGCLRDYVTIERTKRQSRDSRTIVLIPGWCCSPAVWQHCRSDLDAAYDVATVSIAYDRLPRQLAGGATPRALSAAVADAVGQTLGGELVIVGHSLGGRLAFAAAAAIGPRVQRVVAVNSIRGFGRPKGSARLSEEVLLAGLTICFPCARNALMGTMFSAQIGDDTRAFVTRMIKSVPRHTAAPVLAHSVRDPMGDLLVASGTRITALNSGDFGMIDDQAANLEGAVTVRNMPINGHFPMLENPRLFARSLINEIL